VLVAHSCNPSFSGDRDQEDHGSKPAQANSSQDPILTKKKKKNHKEGPVKWLKVQALSSNPSTAKEKKKSTKTQRMNTEVYKTLEKFIVLASLSKHYKKELVTIISIT
jgi:hypothetical protein